MRGTDQRNHATGNKSKIIRALLVATGLASVTGYAIFPVEMASAQTPRGAGQNGQADWNISGAEQQAPATVFPADFRGNATYSGTFEMSRSTPMQMPSSLSLGGFLSAASHARSQTYQGTISVNLQINGRIVTGTYQGTNPFGFGPVNGTRDGDVCHLTTRTSTWNVHCGPDGLGGETRSFEGNNPKIASSITAEATRVVDLVAEQAALAAQQAERQKAQIQQHQAELAAIAAMPPAGAVWTKKVEADVETDSRGWINDRLDRGSVHNVRVADGSAQSGNMTLRAEYTYNGGSPGSVLVKITGGKFDCIQFWNAMVGCRALRTPEYAKRGQDAEASVLDSLLNPSSQGGSSGHGCPMELKSIGSDGQAIMGPATSC